MSGSDSGVIKRQPARSAIPRDGVYRVTGNRNFLKGNRAGARNKGNAIGSDISGSANRFESNIAEDNDDPAPASP